MPIKRRIIDRGKKLFFSEEVKRLRKKRGITQEMMADKLGVSLKTYQNWENRKACPDTIETLFLLCDILECDIEFVYGLQSLPRRIDADIHDETGLPPAAVEALRARAGDKSSPRLDGLMNLLTALIIHGGYLGHVYCEYLEAKAYDDKMKCNQSAKEQLERMDMSEQEFYDYRKDKIREAEFKVLLAVAEAIQRGEIYNG